MRYEVSNISEELPVSQTMMERHIKQEIDDTDYFELVQTAIIKYITNETKTDILLTDYLFYTTGFKDVYTLKKNPIQSLTTFEYLVGDTFTEVDSSYHYLSINNIYGDIRQTDGETMPTDIDNKPNNIRISFKSGYPEGEVPEGIQYAIMNIYASLMQYVGDCIGSKSISALDVRSNIPPMAQLIIQNYTIEDFSIGCDYSGL